ncbi:hypothetical protein FJT64_023447 [Amphibalanus amphitrite]|uniref:Uncharacterized protein n=1 Tax=Amphibalanus amphitrite TaxID=1232801 RepID=A0A6A4WAI9_AMPAM|nr:hypothetical protein FJT64_023447 [Amphibalanus amphitrite]
MMIISKAIYRRSVLVLYRSQQQQICLLTLTASSLPAIQPHNYVSFCCDAGRQYSIHVASQEALKEFVMKAVLAAAQAVDGSSPVALLLASEDHTKTAGGRCAREGDQLTLNVSEWGVQDPRSRPLRQLHSPVDDSGPLLGSWRSSLRGARPGQRWVVADPTSLGVVREVSVTGVRPAPRRPPLRLPTDDGGDWRPGEEPEEELEEAEGTELGVLLGRLEAKLETVLTRLEPPVGVETDAEALAAGVRRLATENAALRETSRGADRATELRLEAERARAAMTSELADSLAGLTDTKRKLAETERRLAAAEEKAVAAEKREEELRMKLTAAQSASTTAGKETSDATRDTRRMLKGVYKTLVARLPPDETFTGAAVAEVAAEVVREVLQRTEPVRVEGRRTLVTEEKEERSSAPPFVAEDECVEAVD